MLTSFHSNRYFQRYEDWVLGTLNPMDSDPEMALAPDGPFGYDDFNIHSPSVRSASVLEIINTNFNIGSTPDFRVFERTQTPTRNLCNPPKETLGISPTAHGQSVIFFLSFMYSRMVEARANLQATGSCL